MASGPVASSPKGFPTFARGADDAHVGPSMHGAIPAPNAGARTAGHISSPMAHSHISKDLGSKPVPVKMGSNGWQTPGPTRAPSPSGKYTGSRKPGAKKGAAPKGTYYADGVLDDN